MEKISLSIIIFLIATTVFSQNFKKVEITFTDDFNTEQFLELGFDLEGTEWQIKNSVTIFLSEDEFDLLSNITDSYKIIIDDWYKYYNNRLGLSKSQMESSINATSKKYNVSSFSYGSMGGFYTLDEVYTVLNEMQNSYPNLITVKENIGLSYENKPIYFVKISDNPEVDESEAEILYTALHHAREPESMMQMIYFMWYLLENYGVDNEVTYLVNNRELFFIPVVNPDGYKYNETTNPNGGGMWRKNRRDNGDGYFGVDLNRNYGPYEYWNAPNGGSSLYSSSSTYRGTAPFSEPELVAIKNFLLNRNFKNCLNYHSYGSLLIFPYGALEVESPDSLIYRRFAKDMTQFNGYEYGTDGQTVGYSTRGNSDDYMYDGDTLSNGKIFTMTPEVGAYSDGFWPTMARIIPLAEENLFPNRYYAKVAGATPIIEEFLADQNVASVGDTLSLSIKIKNQGLSVANDLKLELKSYSPNLSFAIDSLTIPQLVANGLYSNSIDFNIFIIGEILSPQNAQIILTTNESGFVTDIDTVVIQLIPDNSSILSRSVFCSIGWNLISLPVIPINNSAELLFPNSSTTPYYFDNGYKTTNELYFGKGYWIKYENSSELLITGYQEDTLRIKPGWNLVGSFSEDVPVDELIIGCNNSYSPVLWGFTNTYYISDTIKSGRGYWIKSDNECLLTYNNGNKNLALNKPSLNSEVAVEIEITANDGVSDPIIVSIGLDPTATDGLDNHLGEAELPPPPPSGIFYPRFNLPNSFISSYSDYRYKDEPFTGEFTYEFEYQLGTDSEGLLLEWYLADGIRLNISDHFDGAVVDEDFTSGECKLVVNNVAIASLIFSVNYEDVVSIDVVDKPIEFGLNQNYPNPFNPTTVIKYTIPEQSNVRLEIFNMLGQSVKVLINTERSAGYYETTWNAENLPSGIYIVRMLAEGLSSKKSFHNVQKALLLK